MKEFCWSIKEERPVQSHIFTGTMEDKRVTVKFDPMTITYETFEELRMDFRREDGTIHGGATFASYDYEDGKAELMIRDSIIEWLRHHKDIVGPKQ